MSFSTTITGHHGDADALEVENYVRKAGAALRDELQDLFGVTASVSFSGQTGSSIDPLPEPSAEPTPAESVPDSPDDPDDLPTGAG